MHKYITYFNTLKHMKAKQINYRLFYMLRSKYRKFSKFTYPFSISSQTTTLELLPSIESYHSLDEDETFHFLNLPHKFESAVDWNFLGHGKLWAYNLNYFDFLQQKDFDVKIGLDLIDRFIDEIAFNNEGLEPFPIALRAMNWVKFLTYHNVNEQKINDSLYAQYMILMDHLEYHLLGNHLLENGFALLFGAYYFNDEKLYIKAKEILNTELDEQILEDGAHFELTPMYHQIMLYRVLDCLNLVSQNRYFEKELKTLLRSKATVMLSWLRQMSYKDGSIPHFNDSTDGIAPTSELLIQYAQRLGLEVDEDLPLKDSGYRVIDREHYELRVDVGEIGPSYIPGHAHSDTFNFELRVNGKPFIVDTGISTYESNAKRFEERKTSAHNTVIVDGIDQTQVWSSFRVANRAHIISLEEEGDRIIASHDGYSKLGVMHQRSFKTSENSIEIKDVCICDNSNIHTYCAYIHLHPSICKIDILEEKIVFEGATLFIKGSKNFYLDDYTVANGFNKLINSKVILITFESELLVRIVLNN